MFMAPPSRVSLLGITIAFLLGRQFVPSPLQVHAFVVPTTSGSIALSLSSLSRQHKAASSLDHAQRRRQQQQQQEESGRNRASRLTRAHHTYWTTRTCLIQSTRTTIPSDSPSSSSSSSSFLPFSSPDSATLHGQQRQKQRGVSFQNLWSSSAPHKHNKRKTNKPKARSIAKKRSRSHVKEHSPMALKASESHSKKMQKTAINHAMMHRMIMSQVALLGLSTACALAVTSLSGGSFSDCLEWSSSLDVSSWSPSWWTLFSSGGIGQSVGSSLVLGAAAATPMIWMSQLVDQASSRRDTSHVHFATTNRVVTLFGRRHRRFKHTMHDQTLGLSTTTTSVPVQAQEGPTQEGGHDTALAAATSTRQVIASSAMLSALTSATEEIVFRGYIPALLFALTHMPVVAWLGQAVLFGLGHVHPAAHVGENRVVAATQTLNALFGYGLVYIVSGGSLWPCMVAHTLYDLHVLVSSWHKVNTQMDWTEDSMALQDQTNLAASSQVLLTNSSLPDQVALDQIQQWAGPALSSDTLDICRRFFYAFDEDHKHALSLPNVQRAISYAFLQDYIQPSAEQVERLFRKLLRERRTTVSSSDVRKDRIDLSEFVRLLFSIRAQTFKVAT